MKKVIAVLLLLAAGVVHADANLALICNDAGTCKNRTFSAVLPASLVSNAAGAWVAFSSLASTDTVLACKDNIAAGSDTTVCVAASKVQTAKCSVVGANCSNAPAVGSSKINFTVATKNTDGSAYTDDKSFELFRGSSATSLTLLATLPSVSGSYTDANLPAGTWYYGGKSLNSSGVESDLSNVISVTLAKSTKPGPPTVVTVTLTATAP